MRKTCGERREISLLKDVKIGKQFDEKVIRLVYVGVPDMCDISRMRFGVMFCGVLEEYGE